MKTIERIVTTFMAIALVICAFIGGYALLDQRSVYVSAQGDTKTPAEQQLFALQSANNDVAAFLKMDGTTISYGIAQSTDNSTYVNTDIDGKTWSFTGALFLDYRNNKGFSDFNNVIFGHNMDNGMFGDLKKYADSSFINNNNTGELTLADKTYTVDVFAYFITDAYDSMVFDPTVANANPQSYLDYVANKGGQYRNIGVTTSDRLLTLTTCYGSGTDRSILVCRLKDNTQPGTPTPTPTIPIVPTDTMVGMTVPVQKKLAGQTPPSAGTFTFQVTASDNDSQTYLPTSPTVSITGEGGSSFNFTFSQPGTYKYRITEINIPSGYTPSPTGYTLTAYVRDDGAKYTLSSTLFADGQSEKSGTALFENTYDPGTVPTPTPTPTPTPVTPTPTPTPTPVTPTPTPTPPIVVVPTPVPTCKPVTTPPPTSSQPCIGNLTISKTVKGDLGDKNKEFSFQVALSTSGTYTYNGSKSGSIQNGGVIMLKSGEQVSIAGLPVGTTYSVIEREANQDGYETKMSGTSGTISASGATATFVNSKGSKPKTGFEPDEMRYVLLGCGAFLGFGLMALVRIKRGRNGSY